MNFACLARQAFDAEAFGLDFFRVTRLDYARLGPELARLRAMPRVMADARIAASDREADLFLQRNGFRKVCIQIRYGRDVPPDVATDCSPGDTAENRLPPGAVSRHVDNLVYDRFNLDAAVQKAGRDRFQTAWIANSLASPVIRKVYDGESFVSFKLEGREAVVDIVSVLVHRRGVGTRLMGRVLAAAARAGCARLIVTTEAENEPACRMYEKNGFMPEAHFSRFHYASTGADAPETRFA
ncbi:GCN5-related N-acetyltransferase [Solidesulfovibrio fructosivorans JJ]]|uniref:GCN5-related N-acetyltransferase n=1 Tax=Solidesulfovibrio fructosivorans JJ] TaxID=596151 RepID=E1JY76_SOLFR|nr:GNAT family N-acetyltransferase [Solidesulfovibrio fructosivorans]EFL50650.1 GCN5-related N-acetyltransferase [Solidesulfovibrio fructosivorans JJ]]